MTPVLIITFNRPDSFNKMIKALSKIRPEIIRIAIDGPRRNNEMDKIKIEKIKDIIKDINWTSNIETTYSPINQTTRFSIPNAVNWVFEDFDSVIVIEDDVIPGIKLIEFLENCLIKFKNNHSVAHISGYNTVPKRYISNGSLIRKSFFPESYVWATWRNRWKIYNDDINTKQLKKFLLQNDEISIYGKKAWMREFKNTEQNLIKSWAYRWTASIWENNMFCITPNVNLVEYIGTKNGSNTFTKQRWSEVEIYEEEISNEKILLLEDKVAEQWNSKNVFRDDAKDLLVLYLVTFALYVRKIINKFKTFWVKK